MEVRPIEQATWEQALPLGQAWGYTAAEFQRLVDWTDGCGRLVLQEDEGEAVGMALGFPWGSLGFIGDVLVLEAHRGQGLGGRVTEATVQALHDHGCTTVKLYATPKAIPLYERAGFVGVSEHVIARGTHKRGRDPKVVPLADHVEAALALDAPSFGGDRRALVERQLADHPELAIATVDATGQLTGYAMGRPAPGLTEVGPIVVDPTHPQAAQDLVDGLLVRAPEGTVEVTYPAGSSTAQASWSCRGFMPIDTPLEMRLGPPVDHRTDAIVAAGGQELG